MGLTDKENLCLSRVTASELSRYLQGFQILQNRCLAIALKTKFLSFWFSLSVPYRFVSI